MLRPTPNLVKWDKEADEPYLELPSFPELRLTPWRAGDGDQAMKLFNDPVVGKYAQYRPYPYLEEHLDYYRSVINPAVQLTVNTLLRPLLCHSPPHEPLDPGSGNDSGEPFFPSIILRNQETGKMIGNFEVVKPTADAPLADEGGEEHTPVSAQTWEIAYNLLPEWRGKGIAGHAMDVIVEGWVKWIGIGYLMAAIETENPCSAALVKSRGFEISKTFTQPWPEDKGGGEREQSQWVVKVDKYKSRLA